MYYDAEFVLISDIKNNNSYFTKVNIWYSCIIRCSLLKSTYSLLALIQLLPQLLFIKQQHF